MRTFSAQNIKCQNCANAIKNALREDFGEIEVDYESKVKTVKLEIGDEKIADFKEQMDDLGFSVIEEIK